MVNKVAITGASQGIGEEIAAGFRGQEDVDTYIIGGRDKEKLVQTGDRVGAHCSVPGDLFDSNSPAFDAFMSSNAQVQIHNAAINIDGMDADDQERLMQAQNHFMAAKLAELAENDVENPKLFIPVTSITSLFVDELGEAKFRRSPYALMKNEQSHMIERARKALLERGVEIVNVQPGFVNTQMVEHLAGGKGLRAANMFGKRVDVNGRVYTQERELSPKEVGGAISRLAMHYIENGKVPWESDPEYPVLYPLQTWPILNDDDLARV